MTFRHSVPALALLLVPALAAAADEGGTRIKARVGLAATYDTNVFLSAEEAKSAIIGQPSAEAGLRMKGKKASLGLGYEIAPQIYSAYQKANNAIHQKFALSGAYEFKEGGIVGLDDMFRVTADPATSELTERAERNQNDGAFMLDLPVGPKLYIGARAADTIHHYRTAVLAPLLDRNELTVGGRLGLRPTPRTKAYGFFRSASVDFKSASSYNDSTGNLIGAGLEGEITARIKGLVEANTVSRSYSRTLSGETSDYTTGGFAVSLMWEGPEAWSVLVAGGRGFQESVFNRYYVTTSGSLSVTKGIGKKFSVKVLGSYGVDQYPNARIAFLGDGTLLEARRKDSNMSAGFTLSYALMQRQTMKLGYLMRSRSSNFDTYKYSDSQITASADYTF